MLRKRIALAAFAALAGSSFMIGDFLPNAVAQSNASGTVYGSAGTDPETTVTVEGVGTGLRRTGRIDANGRFEVGALPGGHYKVELRKAGGVIATTEVDVVVGQGVEAAFAATSLQAVQVVGRRATIDTSTTTNGAVITAKQLEAIPVEKNLTSILLLAPNTTAADPRYAAGISIGGGAPSENLYNINGFPVTNPLSQLGSMELPYGAISQVEVLTGGFGAEFGRSVGGVVNVTTKSGSNNWEFGSYISVEPHQLRSKPKNLYYPNTGYRGADGLTGNIATDGTIYTDNSKDRRTEYQYGFDLGGPLIKDKLFFFVAADETRADNQYAQAGTTYYPGAGAESTSGYAKDKNVNTRYLGKIDWNITDDHRIEVSFLGDNYRTREMNYGYDSTTATILPGPSYTGHYKNIDNVTPGVGGEAQIFRYIGNLTENLTVTALYGQMSGS